MRPTFITSVHGTWGLDTSEYDWWREASIFKQLARQHNILERFPERLFFWDGELEGVGKKEGWRAGGFSLDNYLLLMPEEHRNLILHSHAFNLWLYGTVKVRNIITIGSPMRSDMFELMHKRECDRLNHLHIYDSEYDRIGLAGQFLDGRISLSRKCPVKSTINHSLRRVSHSKILRDPIHINKWVTQGWFDFLRQ